MNYEKEIRNFIDLFRKYPNAEVSQSIKIKNNHFTDQRFLIHLPSEEITLEQVIEILNILDFPQNHIDDAKQQYANSFFVQFAVEKDAKTNYRVYFGKKYTNEQLRQIAKTKQTIFSGSYKWDINDSSKFVSTTYVALRDLDSKQILESIKQTGTFLPSCIKKIIQENDIKNLGHLFIKQNRNTDKFLMNSERNKCVLFLAEDKNSPRNSFNLRHPKYSISDLSKDIEKKFNVKFKKIFSGYEDQEFDDFSSGIDKFGDCFCTVYLPFQLLKNIISWPEEKQSFNFKPIEIKKISEPPSEFNKLFNVRKEDELREIFKFFKKHKMPQIGNNFDEFISNFNDAEIWQFKKNKNIEYVFIIKPTLDNTAYWGYCSSSHVLLKLKHLKFIINRLKEYDAIYVKTKIPSVTKIIKRLGFTEEDDYFYATSNQIKYDNKFNNQN